ncbi:MAG: hypothetical protein ABIG39_02130 [Candidatus Micrarchaeota archaeon]
MKRKTIALLLILLLPSMAFAQWADDMRNLVAAQWSSGSWDVLCGLALFISFLIAILAYMLSVIIGSPDLKRWAKVEFVQVAASAALVLGLIVFVNLLLSSISGIAFDLADTSTPAVPLPDLRKENPFAVAHYYLDVQMNCVKNYYRIVFILNFPLEIIEKTVLPTGGMEEVTGWPLSGPVGFLYWMEHQYTFILLAGYFQRHLLVFIEDNMFTLFLPLGIFLRILPYTRGAGGVLMSIAIGMFVVFPTMYAVLLVAMPDVPCAETAPSVYACGSPEPRCLAYSLSYMRDHRNFVNLENFIKTIAMELNLIMISSVIFPLVNITVTITFIRAIMQFLGADVAEMGHGIIKII